MRHILSVFFYPGIPGHMAVSLRKTDDTKSAHFFSLNSETHNFLIKNEKPYEEQRHEDDLPYWIRETINTQIKPMINSGAVVVENPDEFTTHLPEPIEIELSPEEHKKIEDSLNQTKQNVSRGTIRYSIFHRQKESVTLHSCASITQEILANIARDDEKKIVTPSFFEQHFTETPEGVEKRAKQLAAHRKPK